MNAENQTRIERDGYIIGSTHALQNGAVGELIECFENPPALRIMPALAGRSPAATAKITGLGNVVVKYYHRGGLFKYLSSQYYLNIGPSRAEAEFKLLTTLCGLDVNVPLPLAYATNGLFFCRNWLVTREIRNSLTLAQLSEDDEELTRRLMPDVVRQIRTLIKARIFHIDLHPGNVLVDDLEKVYLLDFDKARTVKESCSRLRDNYICRWRRAVLKHELPYYLSELISLGLRRNFKEQERVLC